MTVRSEPVAEFDLDAIPAELQERPQWVLWRREEREGKPTKVPYRATDPAARASTTDAATWASLDAALSVWLAGKADGIGFVFSPDDPFAGIDLDACFDADGELHPAAAAIVGELDSYTERSPSGWGLHVLVRGALNGTRNRTGKTPWEGGIEVYDRGRYFTFTGDRLPDAATTIEDRQAELDALLVRILPPANSNGGPPPPTAALDLDDEELLQRAFAAKNGPKVEALYRGDRGDHASQSEADLALCSALAFWTGPDPARIDRLFRGGALLRDKWDTRRGEFTYGEQTIARALEGRTEFHASGSAKAATPEHSGSVEPERSEPRANPEPPAEWAKRRPLDLDPTAEPEPPDYLVAGRIERGTVTVLAGDTGAAKSWVGGQALSVAIVEGADEWLGYPLNLRHRRAVVVDEENPERLARARLRALGLTPEGAPRLRYFHRVGARLGEGDWCEWLTHELTREPADLLVIDTGTAATAPDLSDNSEVAAFYRDHLRPLAADTGVAVLLLLHERKPPTQGPRGARTMATMGARSWIGQADAQLMLARRGEAVETTNSDGTISLETRFTLEIGKLRDGGTERSEVVRVASTLDSRRALLRAEVTSEGDAEPEPTAPERVEVLLRATPGMTLDQLSDETGYAERTVRDALRELGATSTGRPKRWTLDVDDRQEPLG